MTVNGTDVGTGAIFSELEIETHGLTHDGIFWIMSALEKNLLQMA